MRQTALVVIVVVLSVITALGQIDRTIVPYADNPVIGYYGTPTHDPVAALNRKIETGAAQLKFDTPSGYLRSVLDALNVPVESQIAVYSKTSIQAERISPRNPRVLFFNDSVVVGWVPGGFIEVAAEDPQQGVIFYASAQGATGTQTLVRQDRRCLLCHSTFDAGGAPGMLVRSQFAAPDGRTLRETAVFNSDHRSPFVERWGGWYVTGKTGAIRHMGNAMVTDPDKPELGQRLNIKSLAPILDTSAYLSPYSDIVALMVFEHQMHMVNLLTHMGWQTRYAQFQRDANPKENTRLSAALRDTAQELVDYMLFVGEAPLTNKIQGTSGFAERFAADGPRDSRGRSLRQFDLEHRLMKYPCSYMIYSDAFDALPDEARGLIYQRLWQVLSGQVTGGQYARLSLTDRQAIVGILRDTKHALPPYFQSVAR